MIEPKISKVFFKPNNQLTIYEVYNLNNFNFIYYRPELTLLNLNK